MPMNFDRYKRFYLLNISGNEGSYTLWCESSDNGGEYLIFTSHTFSGKLQLVGSLVVEKFSAQLLFGDGLLVIRRVTVL